MAKYERPEYTVLLTEEPFELREYRDFYTVEYDNAADPAVESGFGTLFRYISKDNLADRKISMTVPVIQELSDVRMKMAFVVPKAEWEDIPQPNSPELTVKKFASGLFAVIQYGGYSNDRKEREMLEKLAQWLQEKKYQRASNYMLATFNAPFVPSMFRHNEIMVRIATDQEDSE